MRWLEPRQLRFAQCLNLFGFEAFDAGVVAACQANGADLQVGHGHDLVDVQCTYLLSRQGLNLGSGQGFDIYRLNRCNLLCRQRCKLSGTQPHNLGGVQSHDLVGAESLQVRRFKAFHLLGR